MLGTLLPSPYLNQTQTSRADATSPALHTMTTALVVPTKGFETSPRRQYLVTASIATIYPASLDTDLSHYRRRVLAAQLLTVGRRQPVIGGEGSFTATPTHFSDCWEYHLPPSTRMAKTRSRICAVADCFTKCPGNGRRIMLALLLCLRNGSSCQRSWRGSTR